MKRGYFQKLTVPLLLGVCAFVAASCSTMKGSSSNVSGQRDFSAPQDAVAALQDALSRQDEAALTKIFGPESKDLIDSGDKVADTERMKRFESRLAEGSSFLQTADDQNQPTGKDVMTLLVGHDEWPFPIPLIEENGRWHFDTPTGKDEILHRRIGNNELRALSVCIGVFDAEQEYHEIPRNGGTTHTYASRFLSSDNKRDGLYWESNPGEPQSPIGPLVARAVLEGYQPGAHDEPEPYQGYYYRMLNQQGKNASGGARKYLKGGSITGGFALVAYPAKWSVSGIMTFIVNQDGVVYEKNLGETTSELALEMKAFDPDSSWSEVGMTW